MTSRLASLALAIVLAACAQPRTARFVNAPPVAAVDDRKDTPVAPAPRGYSRTIYHLNGNFVRRLTRAMEVPRHQRALGVNALDEVPDSTWFTNRIGVRTLTPDEIRNGPVSVGSPEAHRPWTVKSTKVGGVTVGFVITDARGEKFVLKFDLRGLPEMETGTDAIVSRILWAAGYNVPEDHVVYFDAKDLVLAADAKVKDVFGNTRPLRRAELDQMLDKVEREPNGRLRGLASRMLVGTWLGGHAPEGIRADDPNDRIPHELRRDMRGSYAIFSWLDHVDVKEDNYLDMWVADEADPSRHYVKHYLLDFGSALGAMAKKTRDLSRGHSYFFDLGEVTANLATLGLRERRWADRDASALRGLGLYETRQYDPGSWKPYNATYVPFHTKDRIDQLWGARILIRFTREQLRAAVETARFSDPRANEALVDMMIERQRKTARYWFERTAPLDGFALRDGALCFDDLMLTYELSRVASVTRYTITTADRDGDMLGNAIEIRPGTGGRSCTAALSLSAAGDGYTVVTIRTRRTSFDGSTLVHIARDANGSARIIGVWRP